MKKGWSKMNVVLIFIDFVIGICWVNGFIWFSGVSG